LLTAAAEAGRQAIAPEAAALASGMIRERFFYQCLAHHLGAAFVDGEIALGAGARYPHAVHAGLAPLDGGDGSRWLAAPRGQLLTHLLARARGGERLGARLAITTPSHLSSLVRAAATASILREASLGLANLDPSLSAKERPSHAQCASAMAAAAATLAFGPRRRLVIDDLFFPGLDLAPSLRRRGEYRLRARAVSRSCRGSPAAGLFGRGRAAPGSPGRAATRRRARRIKLVIEHDDSATRLAIEALDLPATYETVVAPAGWSRTKPRALNIALPLVRGALLVIFDAEDAPAPGQLREAAERFSRAPRQLACLQARLANLHKFCLIGGICLLQLQ
jgi:hypothetical protein